jgi:hypothetical protein
MQDPVLIDSPFSQTLDDGDHRIRICIYRLAKDTAWTLEAVAEDGTSTVWDESFVSDEEALSEALKSIKQD